MTGRSWRILNTWLAGGVWTNATGGSASRRNSPRARIIIFSPAISHSSRVFAKARRIGVLNGAVRRREDRAARAAKVALETAFSRRRRRDDIYNMLIFNMLQVFQFSFERKEPFRRPNVQ